MVNPVNQANPVTSPPPRWIRHEPVWGLVTSLPGIDRAKSCGNPSSIPRHSTARLARALNPVSGLLENGEVLPGFVAEGRTADGAGEITAVGGWKARLGKR
jgi:hypothetical protein